MSVLETVTVDNVTYDIHDPKVGSGTLSTTAQTLIPAVNEVKSGLTTVSGKTDVIGTGSLNTTSQTLIGAVNELAAIAPFTATGTNYVRFSNGVQICWGTCSSSDSSSGKQNNFPIGFASAPTVCAICVTTSAYFMTVNSITTTSFKVAATNTLAYGTLTGNYIAIGKWT